MLKFGVMQSFFTSRVVLLLFYCITASFAIFKLKNLIDNYLIILQNGNSIWNSFKLVGYFDILGTTFFYVISFFMWMLVLGQIPLAIALPFQLTTLSLFGIFLDNKFNSLPKFEVLFFLAFLLIGMIGLLRMLMKYE